MFYTVTESLSAAKALRRMQPEWAERIRRKIKDVAQDPYGSHPNVTRLQGRDGYRLRVGDWRVLYSLEDTKLVLHVVEVIPRGSAYKH